MSSGPGGQSLPESPFPIRIPKDDWIRSFLGKPGKIKPKSIPEEVFQSEYAQYALDFTRISSLRFLSKESEQIISKFIRDHQESALEFEDVSRTFFLSPAEDAPSKERVKNNDMSPQVQVVPTTDNTETMEEEKVVENTTEPQEPQQSVKEPLPFILRTTKQVLEDTRVSYCIDLIHPPPDSSCADSIIPIYGLFAVENIPQNSFICTLQGNLCKESEIHRDLLPVKNLTEGVKYLPGFTRAVLLPELEQDWILDCRKEGSIDARYARHCCSLTSEVNAKLKMKANARLHLVFVQNATLLNEQIAFCLFSKEPIQKGQEILLESPNSGYQGFPCACFETESRPCYTQEEFTKLSEELYTLKEIAQESLDEEAEQKAQYLRGLKKEADKGKKLKKPLPKFLQKLVVAHKRKEALRAKKLRESEFFILRKCVPISYLNSVSSIIFNYSPSENALQRSSSRRACKRTRSSFITQSQDYFFCERAEIWIRRL